MSLTKELRKTGNDVTAILPEGLLKDAGMKESRILIIRLIFTIIRHVIVALDYSGVIFTLI